MHPAISPPIPRGRLARLPPLLRAPRRAHPLTATLFAAIVLLLGANVAIGVFELIRGSQASGALVDFVHVNVEANLTTGFATAQLALASLLLLMTAWRVARAASPMSYYWLLLGVGFAYLAVDEAVQIHERLGPWLVGDPQLRGALRYAWVMPATVAVTVAGIAFVPFLVRLPARIRAGLIAAGAIYVLGAIGMEMVGAATTSYLGQGSVAASASVLEEVGELFGVLLLIHVVLGFRDGAERGGEGAAPPGPVRGEVTAGVRDEPRHGEGGAGSGTDL